MGRSKTPTLSKRNIILLMLVSTVVLVMVGSSVFLGGNPDSGGTPSTLSSTWNTNKGQRVINPVGGVSSHRRRNRQQELDNRRQLRQHETSVDAATVKGGEGTSTSSSRAQSTWASLAQADGTRDPCTLVASVEPNTVGAGHRVENTLQSLATQLQVSVLLLMELNPTLTGKNPLSDLPIGFHLNICHPQQTKGTRKAGGAETKQSRVLSDELVPSSTTAVPAKTFPPGFNHRQRAAAMAAGDVDPENVVQRAGDNVDPFTVDEKKAEKLAVREEEEVFQRQQKAERERARKYAADWKPHSALEQKQPAVVVALEEGDKVDGKTDTRQPVATLPPTYFTPNIKLDPVLFDPATVRRSWMVSKTEDHLCGREINRVGLPPYLSDVGVGVAGQQGLRHTAPEPPTITGPRADYHVTDDDIRDAVGDTNPDFLDSLGMIYVRKVVVSVILGRKFPTAQDVIPVWVEPLFMDADEMKKGLAGVDAPVRQYIFVWNSKSSEMKEALAPLRRLKFGVLIIENGENVGFSTSLNTGIMKGQELVQNPSPAWTFCVNADVSFPSGSLSRIAYYGNKHGDGEYGLIYGFEQEHYAFGITQSAVRRVGLLDEVIWPAYMEDVDYRWRVRLCGLGQIITGGHLHHTRSVNLRFKKGPEIDLFKRQHGRNAGGFAYGHSKWGAYHQGGISTSAPPSGWRTPFNVPGVPLSLWAVDPVQRECVKSGRGVMRPGTPHCWYNGTILLEWLPVGTELPRKVLEPEPNRGYSNANWRRPPVTLNLPSRNAGAAVVFSQGLPTYSPGFTATGTDRTTALPTVIVEEVAAEEKVDATNMPEKNKKQQQTEEQESLAPPLDAAIPSSFATRPPRFFTPNIILDPTVYNSSLSRRSWMISKTEDHLCGREINTEGLPPYLKGVGLSDTRQNVYESAPAPPIMEGPRFDYTVTRADLQSITLDGNIEFLQDSGNSYVRAVAVAVILGRKFPTAQDVIPVWVEPLFMDDAEMKEGLRGVDCPVRQFVFLWNSKAGAMGEALAPLRKLKFGVLIVDNNKNVGFSTSLNTGIMKGQELVQNPSPAWTFCVNADVSFPSGSLSRIAYYGNKHGDGEYGLIYGFEQEHYAFGITQSAVRRVGLLDEVIWPAYMEDVDYRWRVRLCGLGQIITGAPLNHQRSVTLRFKSGPEIDLFKQQHGRNAGGYAYGHNKWGGYGQGDITRDGPPSEWRTPFNIPGFPLSLWAVDPVHRECVKSGRGVFRPNTPHCWYNGTILLERLPPGTKLPRKVLDPEPDRGYEQLEEGVGEGKWHRPTNIANDGGEDGGDRVQFPHALPTSVQERKEADATSSKTTVGLPTAGRKSSPETLKEMRLATLEKMKKKMAELERELNGAL